MTTNLPDLDRPIALHPLVYLDEGGEVTVGRADGQSYTVFPVDGAALLRHLEAGMSPRDGMRWYTDHYGERVDMAEFLDLLAELDLVVPDGEPAAEATAAPVRWQRLGQVLFSPPAWVCYALIVLGAIVVMVWLPTLAPSYHNLFFSSSLVVLEIGLFVGQVPLILVHEAAHALAGRRIGLRSTLGIGWRFYFLVFETTLDGLVMVPRRQRYLPMLAGMLADVLVVAMLTIAAAALLTNTPFIGRLCLAMAYYTILRLVWQFLLFLRTDLYYLAVTVLGCVDLYGTTRQLLRNRLHRLLGKTSRLIDESAWHPRDHAVARWYSWLVLGGYLLLAVALVEAIGPSILQVAAILLGRLHDEPNLTDTVVFLLLNLAQFTLAGVLAFRSFRRRTATT